MVAKRFPVLLTLVLVSWNVASLRIGAQDWNTVGGNRARNGRSSVVGPTSADLLWSHTDEPSRWGYQPFVEGDRVFVSRATSSPDDGGSPNDVILAYDINTGEELWRTTLPYAGDSSEEGNAWIAGVHGGRVYATRGTRFLPVPVNLLPMLALDAESGALLWTSQAVAKPDRKNALNFLEGGDLILTDADKISRVNCVDGTTVWSANRHGQSAGGGAAIAGDAVYIVDFNFGGHFIQRFDANTGLEQYASPTQTPSGLIVSNSPFLSPDGGTVYLNRSNNRPTDDKLFSFTDSGTQLTLDWSLPVRWTSGHLHAIGFLDFIYTVNPQGRLVSVNPASGQVLVQSGVLFSQTPPEHPQTAVDAQGAVYLSNGDFSGVSQVRAMNSGLNQTHFSINVNAIAEGGPILGKNGTLIFADSVGVYAYRDPSIPWVDLGRGKPGQGGVTPELIGIGSLLPDSAGTLTLQDALPNTNALLFLGLSPLYAPFQQGTLVPFPDFVINLRVSNVGDLPLSFLWPQVPGGTRLFFQYWVIDPAATRGLAASNALQATTQ